MTSPGYFPVTMEVEELNQGQPNIALLVKVTKGSSIKLEKVSFERGTSEFEGVETELALKEMSAFLREMRTLSLESMDTRTIMGTRV